MSYPLNTEGLVRDESAPALPDSDGLDPKSREIDDAGVEVAPTLSTDAIDAIDRLAQRSADS